MSIMVNCQSISCNRLSNPQNNNKPKRIDQSFPFHLLFVCDRSQLTLSACMFRFSELVLDRSGVLDVLVRVMLLSLLRGGKSSYQERDETNDPHKAFSTSA